MNDKLINALPHTVLALLYLAGVLLIGLLLSGCAAMGKAVTQSASGKNLNLDGYVMLGELETANPETGTPNGKLIIGRLTYKSRKVGIPADQKVPTAGYFKSTKTKSLFGTEEHIIEYDFTAVPMRTRKPRLRSWRNAVRRRKRLTATKHPQPEMRM